VALLSQGIWRQRFGGDAAALGRLLETSGFAYEVVGVLPESPFPPEHAELWSPVQRSRLQGNPNWTFTRMIGRMAPGVSAEDVKRELDGLIAELPDRFSEDEFRRFVDEGRAEAEVTPLKEWLIGEVERPLWMLLAAAAVVLAIAGVNVAGLVAVRAESQRHELAVRVALGAGRGRLGGHFVAEALLLSLLGGVIGGTLAAAATSLATKLSVIGVPRLDGVGFGVEAAGLATVLVIASTVLLSAASLTVCGRARATGLAGQGRAISPGRARLRAYNLLVASQLALSVILLAGAGLVIREALTLARIDTGFDVDGVLTLRTPFPFQEIQDGEPGTTATPFYDLAAERMRGLPGVTAVGYANCLPLSPDCELGGTTLRRQDQPEAEEALWVVGIVRVSPGYLEALGIPVLAGRSFERADHEQGRGVVLVNAALAQRFWPEGDAISSRLVQDGRPNWGSLEVVGIVGDVHFDDLRGAPEPIAYLPVRGPVTPQDLATASWVVRTALPPTEVAPAVRRAVAALRPDVPVADVMTLADVTAGSTARLRIVLWLLTMASAIAITLSGVGVYGVVAFVASTRRGELGIRLALGAQASELRALVMRQAIIATLAGLAGGSGGAIFMGRFITVVTFDVARPDVATLLAVVLVLGATASVAAWFPALRAARLDPAQVLGR
jgi:predicted permease